MVRSTSTTRVLSPRTSVSQDHDRLFSEIQDSKWEEVLREEERDASVLEVRDGIVEKCLEICYERYMERQAAAFTVRCAYLAWVKVINVFSMPHDRSEDEHAYLADKEPEPSAVDSWASRFMTIGSETPLRKESDTWRAPSTPSEVFENESVKSVPSVYYPRVGEYGEDEYGYPGEFPGESLELFLPRKRSIFTRTLSVSRELLPLFEPVNLGHSQCKEEATNFKKKTADDVVRPAFIDVSAIRANRLEVSGECGQPGNVALANEFGRNGIEALETFCGGGGGAGCRSSTTACTVKGNKRSGPRKATQKSGNNNVTIAEAS